MKAATRIEDLWIGRALVSHALGCSPTQFTMVVCPRLSAEDVRKEGSRVFYSLPAAVKAFLEHKLEGRAAKSDPLDDETLSTPALERMRAAKAEMIELDLAERKRRLIDVDEWRDRTGAMFECLKRYGATMQKTFGREAAVIHNSEMDELKTVCKRIDADIDHQRNANPSTNGKYHERNGK